MLRLMFMSLMVLLLGCHHNIQPVTDSSDQVRTDHMAIVSKAQSLMADFAHRY